MTSCTWWARVKKNLDNICYTNIMHMVHLLGCNKYYMEGMRAQTKIQLYVLRTQASNMRPIARSEGGLGEQLKFLHAISYWPINSCNCTRHNHSQGPPRAQWLLFQCVRQTYRGHRDVLSSHRTETTLGKMAHTYNWIFYFNEAMGCILRLDYPHGDL